MGGSETMTEEYLLSKVEEALKQAQDCEGRPSKALYGIQARIAKLKNSPSIPREKLCYLLNVIAEWQMLSDKSSSLIGSLLASSALANKLEKLEKQLIKDENPTCADENDRSGGSYYRWSSPSVDRSRVHGFAHRENFMERFIMREQGGFKAIALFGVAGVGKTTLCQLVFNNERAVKSFFPRIWVCMSKQPHMVDDYREEVLRRMLFCLGVEDQVIDSMKQTRGLKGLLRTLHTALKGKKYLIVLDDACDSHDFFCNLCSQKTINLASELPNNLASGLPKQHGGAVIVTTPSEKLAKNMVGEENVHQLLPLQDQKSCWAIFADSAGSPLKRLDEHQIEHLKNTIVNKSGGLPLAASMMGKIMKQEQLLAQTPAIQHL